MEIRFISTLTAEDESQLAPALLEAATALLDVMPIAYTLRIETLGAQVYQHTHPTTAATAALVTDDERRHPRTAGVFPTV
jgi:hypothetical protein